jgi:hypothetical protein
MIKRMIVIAVSDTIDRSQTFGGVALVTFLKASFMFLKILKPSSQFIG